jgi:(1->4)-alpha-D-glucan 1-alpha-D-glucosylmutase
VGKDAARVIDHLRKNKIMGAEKFFITWKALQCRKQWAPVFLHGRYIPLYGTVDCGIIAYARAYEHQWVLVIAPVSDTLLASRENEQLTEACISLPEKTPVKWTNAFTGETIQVENNIPLHSIIKSFPVALLTGETK